MTRLILAICSAITVGGLAGLAWFARWLNSNTTLIEIPDFVPDHVVQAVLGD